MRQYMFIGDGTFFGRHPGVLVLVAIVILWTLFWKALALWSSARRGEKLWFGILLVVNSVGILEIIYLVFIAKFFQKKI